MNKLCMRSLGWWITLLLSTTISLAAPSIAAAQGGGDGTSRSSPVSVGGTGTVNGFDLVVVDVVPDASAMIQEENRSSPPPADGNQFFLVRFEATRTGTGSASVNTSLDFRAVGASNIGYTVNDNSCGAFPDQPFYVPSLEPGQSAEFNVCWQVARGDVATLALYVQAWLFSTEPVWFSLGGDPVSASPPAASPMATAPGSQSEPLPIGTTAQAGNFMVTVEATLPQADDFLAEANPFGTPPETGTQFFMATVTLINAAADVHAAWTELSFFATGDSGAIYSYVLNGCGDIPNGLAGSQDVFPGGSVTYNVCWQVASDDAESLVMSVESSDSPRPAWFALREER